MNEHNLPADVATLIHAELRPGEHIIWIGQPMPWRFAGWSVFALFIGIPWTAFAVGWTIAAWRPDRMKDEPWLFRLFPLFGLPFILVGFAMLSTPYWMYRSARRTAYVITNQRALIFDGGWRSTTIRSFEPRQLRDIRRVQNPDGSGNLILERTWGSDGEGGRQSTDHGFLALRDVKAVEALICQLTNGVKDRNT